MALFSKVQKETSNTVYEKSKEFLAEKDGKIHVIMFNSFSKFANQAFQCESKYTNQIESIISSMQDDGYEIVDIKFNVIPNQGITGTAEGFNTLILYK